MLPLYPRFRSVDLLTSVNWIKSCARQEDLSHHPPSPTYTHNCIQSCTNQTAILVAYLLLFLLVPCGKQIIMAAHSESGQLLSHLDPKMWVSFTTLLGSQVLCGCLTSVCLNNLKIRKFTSTAFIPCSSPHHSENTIEILFRLVFPPQHLSKASQRACLQAFRQSVGERRINYTQ